MIKYLLAIAAVFAVALGAQKLELPMARLTLRAIDEQKRPIEGATVRMSFEEAFPQWGGGKVVPVTGKTDSDGKFAGEGHSLDLKGGQVEKEGFYVSWAPSFKFTKIVGERWQPWNPTVEVMMKKIIRPTPMYARSQFETQLPVADEPTGFDLEIGDWVVPRGRGTHGDMIFKLTKRVVSFHDFGAELLLTFPNAQDGIQSMPIDTTLGYSELRSAQAAPIQGYASSLSLLQGNSPQGGEYGMKNEGKNFWFRVRTIVDERGQIMSALYGKIYDGIEWFPVQSTTTKLRFTYYLNPNPNDTGMEFDLKRNLFSNLKDAEQVKAP